MWQLIYDFCAVLIRVINFLVIIRCVLSFLPLAGGGGKFTKLVYDLTEPFLAPVRKLLFDSPLGGQGMMLDFSPVFVIIIGEFLLRILQSVFVLLTH